MFALLSQPSRQPFTDWRARCQRHAEKHGFRFTAADWDSPAWHAMYDVGMKPAEACEVYLED